jgi:uncharacterized protein YbaR (Trm112 family)
VSSAYPDGSGARARVLAESTETRAAQTPDIRRKTVAVQLDPRLMDILACPSDDHAPLRAGTPADPDADVLTCTECGRGFPVVDGIPVLLLTEATAPTGDIG